MKVPPVAYEYVCAYHMNLAGVRVSLRFNAFVLESYGLLTVTN